MSIANNNAGQTQVQRAKWPDTVNGKQVNVGEQERLVSVVGGGLLALWGLGHKGVFRLGALGLAADLIHRGVTGECVVYKSLGLNTAKQGHNSAASVDASKSIKVRRSVTINKSAEEIYNFWRNFENLPRFMTHLQSVTPKDEKQSHWVANAPAGQKVEWDAVIINEEENKLIAWQSLPGSAVMHAGSVEFKPTLNGSGTEVKVELNYEPPLGAVGVVVARILGEEPDLQIQEDLRHLKQLLETGEIPTNKMQ